MSQTHGMTHILTDGVEPSPITLWDESGERRSDSDEYRDQSTISYATAPLRPVNFSPPHVLEQWEPPCLPPHANRTELGRWGEALAAAHLTARGITILQTNWRCRLGEIDIIGRDPARQAIVAFEVKTRRTGGQVEAIEAISAVKLRRLRQLLSMWLMESGEHALYLAIDLFAITVDSDLGWRLHHVEGIA